VILVVIVSDGEKWKQRLKLRLRNNFYVQINHPTLSLAPDFGGTFFGSHAKSAHKITRQSHRPGQLLAGKSYNFLSGQ
jgi:hypothetical protein